jgi:hypothetical protein
MRPRVVALPGLSIVSSLRDSIYVNSSYPALPVPGYRLSRPFGTAAKDVWPSRR